MKRTSTDNSISLVVSSVTEEVTSSVTQELFLVSIPRGYFTSVNTESFVVYLRPGSHLFGCFQDELWRVRTPHGIELYCILLLNMFCICTQLFISKYLLKRKI